MTYDAGCKGSAGKPTITAVANSWPWIGGPFSVQVSNLPKGGIAVMFLDLSKTSIDLGPILGMTGCNLTSSAEISLPFLANASGVATVTGPVPNDPKIVGGQFHLQTFVFDASAAGGAVTSNGGTGTIGAP